MGAKLAGATCNWISNATQSALSGFSDKDVVA